MKRISVNVVLIVLSLAKAPGNLTDDCYLSEESHPLICYRLRFCFCFFRLFISSRIKHLKIVHVVRQPEKWEESLTNFYLILELICSLFIVIFKQKLSKEVKRNGL